MSPPTSLSATLNQGAVFLRHRFPFPEGPKPKFIVFFGQSPSPIRLLFVLTTSDSNRTIPYLSEERQSDILRIPESTVLFFDVDTYIDLNNHRFFDKNLLNNAYISGSIQYLGDLPNPQISDLLEKAQSSKILQLHIKQIICGP